MKISKHKRYILQDRNSYSAQIRLENYGWNFFDVYYERNESKINYWLQKSNDDEVFVKCVRDNLLEFGYLDIFYKNESTLKEIEKLIHFYTEDKLLDKINTQVFKLIDKQFNISLVAISVTVFGYDWQYEMLKNNLSVTSEAIKNHTIRAIEITSNEKYFNLLTDHNIPHSFEIENHQQNLDKLLYLKTMKNKDLINISQRFILNQKLTFGELNTKIESLEWKLIETIHEHENNTAVSLYLPNKSNQNYLRVTDDQEWNCKFIDVHSTNPEDEKQIEALNFFYLETDFKKLIATSKTENKLVSTIMLIGLSSIINDFDWKLDFLMKQIISESKRIKMTVILALTVSKSNKFRIIFTEAIKDKEIRDYAKSMRDMTKVFFETD